MRYHMHIIHLLYPLSLAQVSSPAQCTFSTLTLGATCPPSSESRHLHWEKGSHQSRTLSSSQPQTNKPVCACLVFFPQITMGKMSLLLWKTNASSHTQNPLPYCLLKTSPLKLVSPSLTLSWVILTSIQICFNTSQLEGGENTSPSSLNPQVLFYSP